MWHDKPLHVGRVQAPDPRRTGRQQMTARQIIEARLCRPLGPIATMPPDLRKAMSALAKQLQKSKGMK
jgi:hypothetical protein